MLTWHTASLNMTGLALMRSHVSRRATYLSNSEDSVWDCNAGGSRRLFAAGLLPARCLQARLHACSGFLAAGAFVANPNVRVAVRPPKPALRQCGGRATTWRWAPSPARCR